MQQIHTIFTGISHLREQTKNANTNKASYHIETPMNDMEINAVVPDMVSAVV